MATPRARRVGIRMFMEIAPGAPIIYARSDRTRGDTSLIVQI